MRKLQKEMVGEMKGCQDVRRLRQKIEMSLCPKISRRMDIHQHELPSKDALFGSFTSLILFYFKPFWFSKEKNMSSHLCHKGRVLKNMLIELLGL